MYGVISSADSKIQYKPNEVNIVDNWNPQATSAKDFGGFNYTTIVF